MPPAAVRVSSQSHLSQVSCKSLLSTNDKDDYEMIPAAVYRSPGGAEENPGKLQVGDRPEGCAPSHRLKWDPLPPNEVDRIA